VIRYIGFDMASHVVLEVRFYYGKSKKVAYEPGSEKIALNSFVYIAYKTLLM